MKYYIPDWEDRLDPNFDFSNDKYSKDHKKDPYKYDIYAHQLFKDPPYDGLLFSLSVFQSKISLNNNGNSYQIRGKNNIKEYLKIPKKSKLEIIGDCGAFGYVNEKTPPLPFYSVENVSDIYDKLGFDYGVSVDHLVVDYIIRIDKRNWKKKKKVLSKEEKDKRIRITLNNAKKFLKLHKINNYNYIPIGVAQGYDSDTYKKSVKSLIEIGYEYIGIGGLVRYKTDFILKVINEIQPFIDDINIHLFGISRLNHINDFIKLGVKSFDSASFFRKAWLRSGQNYLTSNNNWYTAIRVPQATNPKILNNAIINDISLNDLKKMEKESLQALIKFEKGKYNIKETLDTILKYDKLLLRNTNDGKNLKEKYRKTLIDKPWENCDCKICKDIGIHVIIFRGCNRNKRRGFHNIWTFKKIKDNIK